MPVLSIRRQAEFQSCAWFQRADSLGMLAALPLQLAPELARVFGSHGVWLRACEQATASLPTHALAELLELYRDQDHFAGVVRCDDRALPIGSGTQSLVFAAFVLETSPAPAALLAEFSRLLRPEGVLLLLTLNPWSLFRLQSQWPHAGVRASSVWARQVRATGLEVERQRFLGPCWPPAQEAVLKGSNGWLPALRLARLTVARRREAGVTPLRWASPGLGRAQSVGAN